MSQRLVASFTFRFEPDWLIKDLLENIKGVVDDTFIYDDRARKELWIPREEHVRILLDGASSLKADWILVISPDERLEAGAGEVIRKLILDPERHRYRFNLREMYTPSSYRVDGIWGTKKRIRLYPLINRGRIKDVDLNLYHLKHISPENRISRAEIHKQTNTADNKKRGFDYLADETGLKLEQIPKGREFNPPYTTPYIFSTEEANR